MKAVHKFRVNWSKREKDLVYHYPLGIMTKSDAHWLNGIFTEKFTDELESRGYDVKTFKFEICPKIGNYKFSSQRAGGED